MLPLHLSCSQEVALGVVDRFIIHSTHVNELRDDHFVVTGCHRVADSDTVFQTGPRSSQVPSA